jgi:pyruvate,water dikinase
VGGKAFNLARLIAAGLPVPDGFAIAAPATDADRAEVERAAAGLGELVAVRSSAVIEDGRQRAAPGLFATRLAVGRGELMQAIAEVVASGAGPAVVAYAGGAAPMAVVVQRQIGGVAGVLYSRAPGDDDAVWLESGERRAVVSRDGTVRELDAGFPLSTAQIGELVALGVAAERAIGAAEPGADVEWVAADRLWLVQARPRTGRRAPQPLDPVVAEAIAFSRGDPRTWRWDAAHNPDPLSPAQAGLVELVSDLGAEEMRVVAGYLYTAPRERSDAAPAMDVLELFAARAAPAMERALAPVETGEPPSLADALAAYRAVVAVYAGELAPALRRARPHGGAAGSSAVAHALATGAPLPFAPAWDIAAPGLDEDAALIERAKSRIPPRANRSADPLADIAEADDLYFFRAQRAVRRALLALAARWQISDRDIFFLPLALAREHAARGTRPSIALASRARAEREIERARAMPLAFADGRRAGPVDLPVSAPDLWRGRSASAGWARGPVAIVGDLGHLEGDPRGSVVAAPSVTPAALVQLAGAVALVCEQGGILGHAAALARELALPCVVGCAGITRELRPGDELLVDGEAGLVVRLGAEARGDD